MWPFSQWTTAGRAALIYITVGTLIVVWALVWYVYLFNNPPSEIAYYWCTGFLVTGLAMCLIGAGLSMYSRSVAPAELPASAAPVALVSLQPSAATDPAAVTAPARLNSPVAGMNGQIVLAPPTSSLPG